MYVHFFSNLTWLFENPPVNRLLRRLSDIQINGAYFVPFAVYFAFPSLFVFIKKI